MFLLLPLVVSGSSHPSLGSGEIASEIFSDYEKSRADLGDFDGTALFFIDPTKRTAPFADLLGSVFCGRAKVGLGGGKGGSGEKTVTCRIKGWRLGVYSTVLEKPKMEIPVYK